MKFYNVVTGVLKTLASISLYILNVIAEIKRDDILDKPYSKGKE